MINHLLVFSFLSLLHHSVVSAATELLDENMMALSIRAMELFTVVHSQDNSSLEGSNLYVDGPNAALSFTEDNYCFAVFDGTTPTVEDWWQNLDPYESSICSFTSKDCCTTRQGFRRAVTNSNFTELLAQDVINCTTTCPECEVVISGQSQGGALANVFAIAYMQNLDPTIIAFGPPGSIQGECSPLNLEKVYVFVNTGIDKDGFLFYDPVPSLNWQTEQRGHWFVMGEDKENVVFYEDNEAPDLFATLANLPFGYNYDAHRIATIFVAWKSMAGL